MHASAEAGRLTLSSHHRPHQVLGRRWCPAGTHLVVTTRGGPGSARHLTRVSTFQGAELLGSFKQNGGRYLAGVSAGASTIYLVLYPRQGSIVLAATPEGTVTARHETGPGFWRYLALSIDGSSLLGVSGTGETIYVCPAAAAMQTISLGRSASQPQSMKFRVSSRDGLAIVTCFSHRSFQSNNDQAELLFVDLAALRVVHRQGLPAQCLEIA